MTNEKGHYAHTVYGMGIGYMDLPTYFLVDEVTHRDDGSVSITSWHRKEVNPGDYLSQPNDKLLHWLKSEKDLFEFEGKQYTRKYFTSVQWKSRCMSFTLYPI